MVIYILSRSVSKLLQIISQLFVFDRTLKQGRINHSGAPYQRKAGPFFIRGARIFSRVHFFVVIPKKYTTFLVVVVTCRPTPNVKIALAW